MAHRTLFVLLISFTLFSYQCKKSHISSFTKIKRAKLPKALQDKGDKYIQKGQQGALENALNIGLKKGLSYKTYKQFKTLNLLHLFTPSGLHYFPIFWILRFFFAYKLLRIFSVFFWIFCLSLDGFYSLKRIAAIKMLWLFRKFVPIQLDLFHITLIVFFFDFLVGSFRISPLSWGYSFLFLGLLTSDPKISFFKKIGIGQICISFFDTGMFNIVNFVSGYIISMFVSFSFPIIFFNYWNPWGDIWGTSKILINSIITLVSFSEEFGQLFISVNSFSVVLIIYGLKKKSKTLLILTILLL